MKIWIYIGGVQNGPYELKEFPGLPVNGNTPVWHEGMADWKPAAKAPATAKYFPDGVKTPAPVIPEAELYSEVEKTVEKEFRVEEENARVSDEPLMEVENEMSQALEEKPACDPTPDMPADARKVETPAMPRDVVAGTPAKPNDAVTETPAMPQNDVGTAERHGPLEGFVSEETVPGPGYKAQEEIEEVVTVTEQYREEIPEEEREARERLEAKKRAKRYPAYLPWSIVLTCLCCTPTSIAAIVTGALTLAARRKQKWTRARKLSRATEWLVIISITLGIMSLPFSIIFQGFFGM